MSTIMDEIRASRAEVRQLTNRVDKMSVGSVSQRSPTPESRHATFASDRWSPVRYDAIRGQAGGRPFRRGSSQMSTTRSRHTRPYQQALPQYQHFYMALNRAHVPNPNQHP